MKYYKYSSKRFPSLATQKGFGLLELGLALLVIAVLGIYAYGQYASAREETQAQSEVADITSYWAKSQERYANQRNYTGLTTVALIQSNVFPASMILVPSVSVINKYQGNVTAAASTLTTADDGVDFTVSGYSTPGCSSVVPKVSNGARRITIGGTVVKPLDGQLDIAALGTQCSASPVGAVVYSIGR